MSGVAFLVEWEMGERYRPSLRGIFDLQSSGFGAVVRVVVRFPDLVIVPWILEERMLLAYLLARSASLLVPLVLVILGWKVLPQLVALSQGAQQNLFQGAAARINLGYLMVCSAVGLMVLTVGPRLVGGLGSVDPAFGSLLLWLVVGQSAPILFGATGLLMQVVDRSAFYTVLSGVTAAMFWVAAALSIERQGVEIAQILAAAQLTHAAICAGLLTQCGVWPGLTALFHKEIRLF